jgi:hypothetical protein
MAKPSLALIQAIRRAAHKIEIGSNYQWGHMGSCNCGHLAQEITKLTKAEIHKFAMQKRGDWNEQVIEYCPTSGYPMDKVITIMIEAGLEIEDLKNLERLSDQKILDFFPIHERNLQKNKKNDVAKYMLAWAEILEDELIKNISLEENFSSKNEQIFL